MNKRTLAATAVVCCLLAVPALASREALGLVYQPLQDTQSGALRVTAIPVLSSEPGGLEHALPLICRSNVLLNTYARLASIDSNAASDHGIRLQVLGVEYPDHGACPALLLDLRAATPPEFVTMEQLLDRLVECIARTVASWRGGGFTLRIAGGSGTDPTSPHRLNGTYRVVRHDGPEGGGIPWLIRETSRVPESRHPSVSPRE